LDGSNLVKVAATCSHPHIPPTQETALKVLETALETVRGPVSTHTGASSSTARPSAPSRSRALSAIVPEFNDQDTPGSYRTSGLVGWFDAAAGENQQTPNDDSLNYSKVKATTIQNFDGAMKTRSSDAQDQETKMEILESTLIDQVTRYKIQCSQLLQSQHTTQLQVEAEIQRRDAAELREIESGSRYQESINSLVSYSSRAQSRIVELEAMLDLRRRGDKDGFGTPSSFGEQSLQDQSVFDSFETASSGNEDFSFGLPFEAPATGRMKPEESFCHLYQEQPSESQALNHNFQYFQPPRPSVSVSDLGSSTYVCPSSQAGRSASVSDSTFYRPSPPSSHLPLHLPSQLPSNDVFQTHLGKTIPSAIDAALIPASSLFLGNEESRSSKGWRGVGSVWTVTWMNGEV